MSKQIWLSPVLGNNRTRLVERCAELIADGRADSVLYLAASHPLLELVTAGLLDGERNRCVRGTLPVHLFGGFVRHMLGTAVEEETGLLLAPRIPIDREEVPLKRSLLARLISALANNEKLNAIGQLARSEGCVSTIASLIGEIQRAARTPAEFAAIVELRESELNLTEQRTPVSGLRQIDFDREIALIYSLYASALDQFHLSDDDADQLRALSVLRGEVDGKQVRLPWIEQLSLLVLDGFFDFTPVQGEILRLLIPRVSAVIVNMNGDERNREIFRPYDDTIKQLRSIADFEVFTSSEEQPVKGLLYPLRARLFNPDVAQSHVTTGEAAGVVESAAQTSASSVYEKGDVGAENEGYDAEGQEWHKAAVSEMDDVPDDLLANEPNIRLLECSDRETEIRTIAKEIKRLVLIEGYELADIALVVRQRASYADAIARICEDEGIPCTIERRVALVEVPAVRAALKLFRLLREIPGNAKISDLADLLKSEYWGPDSSEVAALRAQFDAEYEPFLKIARKDGVKDPAAWDVDELENAIAYVGGELRLEDWIARARRLAGRPPKPFHFELIDDDEETEANGLAATDAETEEGAQIPPEIEQPGSEVKPRVTREVHPVAIAWAARLIEYIIGVIGRMPLEGRPSELRLALLSLLDRLQFVNRIKLNGSLLDADLPRATLDLRGLEGMRRAFSAAIRSIEIAEEVASEARVELQPITMVTLIDEITRCMRGQAFAMPGSERDGLPVLEATDVRGLRFRAIFIAGLIEGGFPLRTPRDWIYPHEERERLKLYGLTLEDISPASLLKEEHYFYQAACRATERLYLSRPLMLEGDNETVASYYIEELKQAVAPFEIGSRTVAPDFDGRELFEASTTAELAVSLVRQSERHRHRRLGEGLLPASYIENAIVWARENKYISWQANKLISMERERAGRRFTNFDGEISHSGLIAMLSEQFGQHHIFSASELSLYGKCPFKFYAEKVLRLEPRGEAALDLKALDAGKLLHEVLRRFFERHRMQQLTSLDRELLRGELQEVADEVFDEHERVVPPLNPQVWRIDREIRKILLDQVLLYELGIQEKTGGRMRPAYFELGFGMKDDDGDPNSTRKYLEFSRQDEELVRLRGRIDRVDIADDGTVIAYDYKLSKGASTDDMRAGRELQIGTYLAALESLFLPGRPIAGGGYYILRGKADRRNRGLYRKRFVDYTNIGNVMANLSDTDWAAVRRDVEVRMWEFIDGMRKGRFRVLPSAPKDSCPRCNYSVVCRYEAFRIREKELASPS